MKIIHLSDLHVDKSVDHNKGYLTILNYLKNSPDIKNDCVIVITGDLIDNAKVDFENNTGKLQKIWNEINALKSKVAEIFVVPSNHDYGNKYIISEDYMRYFKTIIYGNDNIPFPRCSPAIGDYIFIGLDSNEAEIGVKRNESSEIYLGTIGKIGESQRNELEKIITDKNNRGKKFILYFHHDPISHRPVMFLEDRNDLKKIIKNNISLLLCGHTHKFRKWNAWGIPIYNAGCSTFNKGESIRIRCFDMIHDNLVPSEITLEVE